MKVRITESKLRKIIRSQVSEALKTHKTYVPYGDTWVHHPGLDVDEHHPSCSMSDDADLTCPECGGTGCDNCNSTGEIEPYCTCDEYEEEREPDNEYDNDWDSSWEP